MVEQAQPETIYSKSAKDILDAERREIMSDAGPNLFGLALSGGGIRSASFALGVLQALYGFGAFDKFHYLSTVSGGGYIGTALTYFRNIFNSREQPDEDQPRRGTSFHALRMALAHLLSIFGPRRRPPAVVQPLGQTWFPFGYLRQQNGRIRAMDARPDDPVEEADGNEWARRIVSYLRQHAAFLVPSRQLGLPALIAGVLRGLVTTALPYLAILVSALAILVLIHAFERPLKIEWLTKLFPTLATEAQPAAPPCPPDPCAKIERPAPGVYLAAWPTIVGFGIAGAFLVLSLLVSFISGLISRFDHRERYAIPGYQSLIYFYAYAGWFLVLAGASLLAATLPWLWEYLNYLLADQQEQKLPGTFAALASALGGAVALIGKMRGVLGGAEQKPSLFRRVWMVLAGIAFVYGIFLLAYAAALSLLDAPLLPDWIAQCLATWGVDPKLFWPAVVLVLGLVATVVINVNHAAQHRLYRDRLMEVFCAEEGALATCGWRAAKRAQSKEGWLKNLRNVDRPYHIINTCIITTDSTDRRFRGRGGDNFILSPLYCGSDATGWAKTSACMPTLSIATAAAISGAALNAHSGPHGAGLMRNKAYSAVLSFLGLHLGYWARNPSLYKNARREPLPSGLVSRAAALMGWRNEKFTNLPKLKFPNLLMPGLAALTGVELNEHGHFVQLSDGGHFENLAIYELIRRRVHFLWVSDAGQDGGFSFEDMSNAIERVRVDFGVNIRFRDPAYDLTHLIPGAIKSESSAEQNFFDRYKLATRGYAIGTIEYPGVPREQFGVIVYVKSTLTRGLPGDLYGYKARNNDFPHQTTLDQFFDEEQFEAYRELGYRLASQLFRDIDETPDLPPALQTIATKLELR
jgi:hypothetical protein